MTKSPTAAVATGVKLDLVHVTAAPPYAKTLQTIATEIGWISKVLTSQGATQILYPKPNQAPDLLSPLHVDLLVVLGLQHPPEDVTNTAELCDLAGSGVRITTLSYELESRYGGGFATPEAILTPAGYTFLQQLAAAEMILDLSHAGWKTASDALGVIEDGLPLPVIASHSGCASIYDHKRNLPDEIIRRIGKLHGIIGIPTLLPILHASNNSLSPFFRHIERALSLVGEDAVAIGSDGIYKTLDLDEQKKNFDALIAKIDPRGNFKARFPDQPTELNSPYRMEILYQLLEEQFSRRIAAKICGDNIFKFLMTYL